MIDDLSSQYEFALALDGKEKPLYGQIITRIETKIKLLAVCKKSGVRHEIEIEV